MCNHMHFQLNHIHFLLYILLYCYSEYENGKRTIPIQHLITLAKFYGTTIDYIVGLSDENSKLNNKKTS